MVSSPSECGENEAVGNHSLTSDCAWTKLGEGHESDQLVHDDAPCLESNFGLDHRALSTRWTSWLWLQAESPIAIMRLIRAMANFKGVGVADTVGFSIPGVLTALSQHRSHGLNIGKVLDAHVRRLLRN